MAAGDGSLSSFPETVITRYWYTLPRLRSLENIKKTMSYTDTMWRTDKIDPLEYILSVLLIFEIPCTFNYPVIFIVYAG